MTTARDKVPFPPSVPGDSKNWTWVIERPCPECGFDARTVEPAGVADRIRANAAAWVPILSDGVDRVRARPQPTIWSALEYACHVRDVFDLYTLRLHRMRTEDTPTYANWDQDATAVAERYDLADPPSVAIELTGSAEKLAAAFDTMGADEWQRRGIRSDGAEFTIVTFSTYLVHDPEHHLWDVTSAHHQR